MVLEEETSCLHASPFSNQFLYTSPTYLFVQGPSEHEARRLPPDQLPV